MLPLFTSRPAAPTKLLLEAGLAETLGPLALDPVELAAWSLALPERADIIGLEVALGGAASTRVDISVGIGSSPSISELRAWVQRQTGSRTGREQLVLAFSNSWAMTASTLRDVGPVLYLELDRLDDGYSSPSVFLRSDSTRFPTLAAALDALLRLLPSLLEPGDHERATALARKVFAAPPDDCRLTYLGVMSRSDELARICVALPMHTVPAFLETLGKSLPGSARRVLPLAERAGWIDLSFGISRSGLTAKFGIELTPSRLRGAQVILKGLDDFASVEASRRDAVAAWLGQASRTTTHSFSHAKVTFQDDGSASAKAYLAVTGSWPKPGQ